MSSTGEGNAKQLQYSCFENPMNDTKRQKDSTLKDESPRSVGAQYATRDQWRNNSRKNEETWNVRSMNQGKLEVVKQGDGKREHLYFRNQWTKMDGNG